MTERALREVVQLIGRSGGSQIRLQPGGKHTRIIFLDLDGVEQWITFHRGTRQKRHEDSVRSELRRRGLKL